MGLFQSRQDRTECLLRQGLETLLERISVCSQSDPGWKATNELTHSTWLTGGFFAAADTISQSKAVGDAWGKGDAAKALALIEVVTLPMISRWYMLADTQLSPPPETARRARALAAWNVLDLFAHASDQAVAGFLDMDAQYNRDCERIHQGSAGMIIPYESVVVLSRAVEACGGPPAVRWDPQTWPVSSIEELAATARTELPPFCMNPLEVMAVHLVLNSSARSMLVYFNTASAAQTAPRG
jgi:hypothetical protein